MARSVADIYELVKDIPPGAWVAISGDRHHVLAYGPDAQDVLTQARSEGEEVPLIVRVPEIPVSLFF
jgi:Family of unknown function (DUF5678)